MKAARYLSGFTLIILCLLSCNTQPLPRIFLIPASHEGALRIIYAENCGVNPKEENGREVYEFQQNGFVILKTDLDQRMKNDYYLVDDKGSRTKVKEISHPEDRFGNTPVVIVGETGVSSSDVTYDNSKMIQTKGGATYVDLILYNKQVTKAPGTAELHQLDSLTNMLVAACRTGE